MQKTKVIQGLVAGLFCVAAVSSVKAQNSLENAMVKSTVGLSKAQLQIGSLYYIGTSDLNVRSSTVTSSGQNIVGHLQTNDQVQVVDLLTPNSPLVQIKIIQSVEVRPDVAPQLYISKDYLSPSAIFTSASRYFVIQNIATEKTRVYERCTSSPGCPHQLVFEADNVVGRPEVGTATDPNAFKTWLGHARINDWYKFYQDGAGHYPYWYKAGQDLSTIPAKAPRDANGQPKASLSWGKQWMYKENGENTIYGAFGWYAARLTPGDDKDGMNYQWMHGTMGWASDGDAAIDLTRSFLLNVISNPASSGCTRLSNASIAYLRSLLPPGTDIYRVYARESTRESTCAKKSAFGGCKQERVFSRYAYQTQPIHWEYIMLTDEAQRSNGLAADADMIRAMHVPVTSANLIEQGFTDIVQYPHPVQPNYQQMPSSGKTGDRYMIDPATETQQTNFHGYFLVDEGRFIDYAHPDPVATHGKIHVSGMLDFRNSVPEDLRTSGPHSPPDIIYQRKSSNGN